MKSILEAIWIKRFKRGPMDSKQKALVEAGLGLQNNADQGGKRQVTIIEKEIWDIVKQSLDESIEPTARRANLMVSGISLAESRGRILQIGDVRFKIHGETRPCERMDEAFMGLRKALQKNWGGGAYAEVLDDGEIQVGDSVRWVDKAS